MRRSPTLRGQTQTVSRQNGRDAARPAMTEPPHPDLALGRQDLAPDALPPGDGDSLAYPDQAYGQLTEGLHVASYTLERALSALEALLAGEAWRRVEPGYADINAFMDSIRLDQFKANVDQRQRIVKRIKELQPAASNRQIARTLGVGKDTVSRDLGANAPRGNENAKERKGAKPSSGANAPAVLTGTEAAKRVLNFEKAPFKRAERRAAILQGIIAANPPLPTGRRYPVIYSDPAWRWEAWSRETGLDHAPEAHYGTMTVDEIRALDVRSIAAEDGVLFLWATAPLLPQALGVMSAWGFAYKTNLVWIKNRAGTGYWVRGQHEFVLIGTRGKIPCPLPGTQGPSVIEAPDELIERRDSMTVEARAAGHSVKPAIFAELIERWFPSLPKIELFARGKPRPGWDIWGNEAEAAPCGRAHR
jgi:N6-adenosine-specific RNA methylase IME4